MVIIQTKGIVCESLNTLYKCKNVEIIAGAVCVNHVNLSDAILPKIRVSYFRKYEDKRLLCENN